MLNVHQLVCRRGLTTLFHNLDLNLNPGEMIYLKGANGAGKTTLLRTIAGLSTQEAGTVLWDGVNIQSIREEFTSKIIFIGHAPAVKDDFTVAENLITSLQLSGTHTTDDAITHALSEVGLEKRRSIPTRALSQGQKKRLALARLWTEYRPLWLLDEPFNALDFDASKRLENQLERHLLRDGMVILTSHQEPNINSKKVRELNLSA
jgi:heme exporter protein A